MTHMTYKFDRDFARQADAEDPLGSYRKEFLFPQVNGRDSLYFTGNSLGLQPVKAREYLNQELDDWASLGVEGHVESRRPWLRYHEFFSEKLAAIVGAKKEEVVTMGGLTTNLHLLMVSFFRPKGKRRKILCEAKAFPSDRYALRSQLRFHGLNPDKDLIEVEPDAKTGFINEEKLMATIDENAREIALVMLGGVNYYTGQVFNMKEITARARAAGAVVGWDLAHAAGNVELDLHHWEVDFAAWCGYKYLNSGPGGVSGVFIHQRHHGQKDIPRFEGWWGHNVETRFKMGPDFDPTPTAEAWQLSNAPVFSMTPLLASLELFDRAGMPALREKSQKLTGYLEHVIGQVSLTTGVVLKVPTPGGDQRGCQLSLVVPEMGKSVFNELTKRGVIADWREPDVIRLAPVPLYNSFSDVFEFGMHLQEILTEQKET
jgi:kynureninase